MYYIEDMSVRAAKTIRMREDIYHQAKVAAVVSRKSVGQWIEEAVAEKVRREAKYPLLEAIDSENPSTAGQTADRRAG
ncbi:MAG: hypothetical protein IH862_11345 [Chloroflexi bacterium]|nr:hypothetical protein [Chloroflexota bacterium]